MVADFQLFQLLLFLSVLGLPLATNQASPKRHVDREAHRAALPGLRLGPVRGLAAQPAPDGPSPAPPVNFLPVAKGHLQDVRLHGLP